MGPRRVRWAVLGLAVTVGVVVSAIPVPLTGAASSPGSATSAYVRVNQLGYEVDQPKLAILLSGASESGASFALVDSHTNVTVYSGSVGTSLGKWSSTFPFTYSLNFTSLKTVGSYVVEVTGHFDAVSPVFTIATGAQLYEQALANALFFYEVQQDGPNVNSSALDRQPSHLTDEKAMVYSTPTYKGDVLQGSLDEIGGPVNVSGGWFDAGDYLKFVETASYATALMLFAVREYPALTTGNATNFRTEAMTELSWLMEMWNESTLTLYYQVGIGDGNHNITGDHDLWRLPQEDDRLNVTPGDKEYYIKYRPVFEAGPSGSVVTPNLAGRLAADFGLCYQVFLGVDPVFADQCLRSGESVFDLANTTGYKPISNKLLTTAPYSYYPQTSWQDDLELGAAELTLAIDRGNLPSGLPHTDPLFYLESAANWSHAYITGPENGTDTLNLYDVSGLADYELYRAIQQAGNPKLAVTTAEVLRNLGEEVETGVRAATHDPFGLGLAYNSGEDLVPHALGLAIESALYDQLAQDSKYATFGYTELDWVLGENAWGSSFIVGDGTTFPDCLQHQVANLVGSLNGTSPLDFGATVDGPTLPSNLKGLGNVTGMRACPVGGGNPFKEFNGHGAAYEDNVVAWPTVEPADDYTAPTIVLFAMQVAGVSI